MIKTTITAQPTTRPVNMECPNCKTPIMRTVKLDQQKGNDECALCHTKFEWEETNNK